MGVWKIWGLWSWDGWRVRQSGVPLWGLTLTGLSRWGALREPILEPRRGGVGGSNLAVGVGGLSQGIDVPTGLSLGW